MEKKNNVEEILEIIRRQRKGEVKNSDPSFKKLEIPGIGTIWVHKLNF